MSETEHVSTPASIPQTSDLEEVGNGFVRRHEFNFYKARHAAQLRQLSQGVDELQQSLEVLRGRLEENFASQGSSETRIRRDLDGLHKALNVERDRWVSLEKCVFGSDGVQGYSQAKANGNHNTSLGLAQRLDAEEVSCQAALDKVSHCGEQMTDMMNKLTDRQQQFDDIACVSETLKAQVLVCDKKCQDNSEMCNSVKLAVEDHVMHFQKSLKESSTSFWEEATSAARRMVHDETAVLGEKALQLGTRLDMLQAGQSQTAEHVSAVQNECQVRVAELAQSCHATAAKSVQEYEMFASRISEVHDNVLQKTRDLVPQTELRSATNELHEHIAANQEKAVCISRMLDQHVMRLDELHHETSDVTQQHSGELQEFKVCLQQNDRLLHDLQADIQTSSTSASCSELDQRVMKLSELVNNDRHASENIAVQLEELKAEASLHVSSQQQLSTSMESMEEKQEMLQQTRDVCDKFSEIQSGLEKAEEQTEKCWSTSMQLKQTLDAEVRRTHLRIDEQSQHLAVLCQEVHDQQSLSTKLHEEQLCHQEAHSYLMKSKGEMEALCLQTHAAQELSQHCQNQTENLMSNTREQLLTQETQLASQIESFRESCSQDVQDTMAKWHKHSLASVEELFQRSHHEIELSVMNHVEADLESQAEQLQRSMGTIESACKNFHVKAEQQCSTNSQEVRFMMDDRSHVNEQQLAETNSLAKSVLECQEVQVASADAHQRQYLEVMGSLQTCQRIFEEKWRSNEEVADLFRHQIERLEIEQNEAKQAQNSGITRVTSEYNQLELQLSRVLHNQAQVHANHEECVAQQIRSLTDGASLLSHEKLSSCFQEMHKTSSLLDHQGKHFQEAVSATNANVEHLEKVLAGKLESAVESCKQASSHDCARVLEKCMAAMADDRGKLDEELHVSKASHESLEDALKRECQHFEKMIEKNASAHEQCILNGINSNQRSLNLVEAHVASLGFEEKAQLQMVQAIDSKSQLYEENIMQKFVQQREAIQNRVEKLCEEKLQSNEGTVNTLEHEIEKLRLQHAQVETNQKSCISSLASLNDQIELQQKEALQNQLEMLAKHDELCAQQNKSLTDFKGLLDSVDDQHKHVEDAISAVSVSVQQVENSLTSRFASALESDKHLSGNDYAEKHQMCMAMIAGNRDSLSQIAEKQHFYEEKLDRELKSRKEFHEHLEGDIRKEGQHLEQLEMQVSRHEQRTVNGMHASEESIKKLQDHIANLRSEEMAQVQVTNTIDERSKQCEENMLQELAQHLASIQNRIERISEVQQPKEKEREFHQHIQSEWAEMQQHMSRHAASHQHLQAQVHEVSAWLESTQDDLQKGKSENSQNRLCQMESIESGKAQVMREVDEVVEDIRRSMRESLTHLNEQQRDTTHRLEQVVEQEMTKYSVSHQHSNVQLLQEFAQEKQALKAWSEHETAACVRSMKVAEASRRKEHQEIKPPADIPSNGTKMHNAPDLGAMLRTDTSGRARYSNESAHATNLIPRALTSRHTISGGRPANTPVSDAAQRSRSNGPSTDAHPQPSCATALSGVRPPVRRSAAPPPAPPMAAPPVPLLPEPRGGVLPPS